MKKYLRSPSHKTAKIAIIGAGISGITAALSLKRFGYSNVTVFEKEKNVGGKIQTVFYRDKPYELGALVANHDFKRIMYFAKKYANHPTKTPVACIIDDDGSILSYQEFVKKKIGMGSFLASSIKFWHTLHRFPEVKKIGLKNAREELYEPMSDFADKQGISAALTVIKPFLTACGYGYYEQIPALYLMKLAPFVLKQPFTDIISFGFLKTWSTFDRGFHDLLLHMSRGLDIRFSSEVTQIIRDKNSEKESIEVRLGVKTERFDRIIISTPLEKALCFLDVTAEEKKLFQPIHYTRYLTTLVEGSQLLTSHYLAHTKPEKLGHINCIVQEHPDQSVFQIYQMLNTNMTVDDALNVAVEDLRQIGGEIIKVIAQKEWTYFPHVSSTELKQGYYEALENIQGTYGTYYCGSLFNFETVEHNIRYAENLIQFYFGHQHHAEVYEKMRMKEA